MLVESTGFHRPCLTVMIPDGIADCTEAYSTASFARSMSAILRQYPVAIRGRHLGKKVTGVSSVISWHAALSTSLRQLKHTHVAIDVTLSFGVYSPRVNSTGVAATDLPGDTDRLESM